VVNYPQVEAGGRDDVSTFMRTFVQVTTTLQSNTYPTWGFRRAVLFQSGCGVVCVTFESPGPYPSLHRIFPFLMSQMLRADNLRDDSY
jgi:hypothetical protein